MGSATVEKLIQLEYYIVIVNRGNWYWDSATKIKPHVQHVKCDRMRPLQKCSELLDYLQDEATPTTFDAVIDFSAYHPLEITEALDVLDGRMRRYIYISSDSVYEVCHKNHSLPTREIDAVRPDTQEERDELEGKESYGHRKLACEEELESQYQKGGVPFISLRLPDVIGPRDNTLRWWIYQTWFRLADYLDKKVVIPAILVNHPMSLVYVDDVANAILICLHTDDSLYNQAYNLALNESPSLFAMLDGVRTHLKLPNSEIRLDKNRDSMRLFPSVTRGTVDTDKAKVLLGWKPTPWDQVLKETTEFYEAAFSKPEFDIPVKDLVRTMQTHFSSEPFRVLTGFKHVYGYVLNPPKDEL